MTPTTAIEWNDEGHKLYNEKKFGEAEVALLKAIELDPKNPIFYKNLGDIYYDMGKTDEGLRYYKTAIQMNENDPNFLLDYSIILHNEKQERLALEFLTKANRIDPDNIEILVELAVIYFSLKEFIMAIKNCQRILIIRPNHEKAQYILAKCFYEQNNLSAAEKTLDTMLESYSTYAPALLFRAQLYKQKKDTIHDLELTMKAFHANPNSPEIVISLYEFYENDGLFGRIFSLVNEYRKEHPVVDCYLGKRIQDGKELLDYLQLGVEFREALSRDTQDISYSLTAEKYNELVNKVESFINEIIEQSQKDPEAEISKFFQGFFEFTKKRYLSAYEILSKITQINTEVFYFLTASSSFLMKSYRQAHNLWKLFFKINKQDGAICLFNAFCAYQLQELDLARENLELSYHFKPEWKLYYPTIESFTDPSIQDDFFGISIQKMFNYLGNTITADDKTG